MARIEWTAVLAIVLTLYALVALVADWLTVAQAADVLLASLVFAIVSTRVK